MSHPDQHSGLRGLGPACGLDNLYLIDTIHDKSSILGEMCGVAGRNVVDLECAARQGTPSERAVIELILPARTMSAESFADIPDAGLFPEEAAAVARAVDKRRREFATARACARSALAGLGVASAPIPPGEGGAPRWPDGIVGSITHCPGYHAAAVARSADMLAIGIDAEPDTALPDRVLDMVSLPRERARLRHLAAAAPDVSWDRLLFCAKEAVYKAWFPLAGRWLGFEDADVTIDATGGTFEARLLRPGPAVGGVPLAGFAGRWLASGGFIVAAIAVPVIPACL
jgi:4'-phosphopantetheinyl transferase EntD